MSKAKPKICGALCTPYTCILPPHESGMHTNGSVSWANVKDVRAFLAKVGPRGRAASEAFEKSVAETPTTE